MRACDDVYANDDASVCSFDPAARSLFEYPGIELKEEAVMGGKVRKDPRTQAKRRSSVAF